ncbi:MAG: hypothetical protein KKA16_06030 [Alphaproteobacteria bacterium]|nr:hypothetical protein [Alphaproteobacteria bacterium]MBU2380408.1 hypothetical protein [Alphaproteobacteria bacterium]
MTGSLMSRVERDLQVGAPDEVMRFAEALSAERDTAAVLFYGSILRTGHLDGVLDFYVLTNGPHRRGLRGWLEHKLWPEVDIREWTGKGVVLRAKVATLPLSTFAEAAQGRRLDTTIWTRFVQPSALVWAASDADRQAVTRAVADAVVTAGRYAAVLGLAGSAAPDWWRALFAQTYRAEFRVERPGREDQIVGFDPGRYGDILRLAWTEAGIAFAEDASGVTPTLSAGERGRLLRQWRLRRRLGKPLNLARLVKAAFSFDGAARYAAWKIERHTGMAVPLTPWREKHPVLASPGVLWRLWRRRRAQRDAR